MKIYFFHLMPYRFLPDDFREKYRGVWVDIPSHLIPTHALSTPPGRQSHASF